MKYIKKFEIDNGSSVEKYIPIPPIATSETIGGIKASLKTEENVEAAIDENGSLFVPEYPNLDNKVNKNGYSEEDYGKVLGTDDEGSVVLKEVKSASDNNPIGIVEKTLNPSVGDCFNSSIKNLKLYGQSTQGADPSPTNKQDVTAISEFDGNIRNSFQLFDASKIVNQEISGVTISSENGKINLSGTATKSFGFQYSLSNQEFKELFKLGNVYIKNNTNLNLIFTLYIRNDSGTIDYAQQNKSLEITDDLLNNQQNYAQFYFFITQGTSLNGYVRPMIYQDGDGTWEPFDSNPQEVLYTTTQNMYSTQDGSIADYVDVEKGVEVYQLGAKVYDGSVDEVIAFGWEKTKTVNFTIANTMANINKAYSDRFQNFNSASLDQNGISNNSTLFYISIEKTLLSSIDVNGFRTWLSQNPITVIYPLATPTETPIPQEQLQMLRALHTYNGVTNFLCNSPVSFKYEQSLQIIIDNILKSINNVNVNTLLLKGGI